MCGVVQSRLDAFRQRFPSTTEHGVGVCTMKRCTHPFLFASGLSPDEAQTDQETWGPAVQEVAIPCPLTNSAPLALLTKVPFDSCHTVA